VDVCDEVCDDTELSRIKRRILCCSLGRLPD
jgi:hypothetical protein